MATVLMQKDGQADIYVDTSQVQQHVALGWHRAVAKYSSDGMTLIIPDGAAIDFQKGALKLNSVQLTASAAELDTLDVGANEAATVHYEIAPAAVSAAGVAAATALSAAAQDKAAGLTNPDVPRTVTVTGNVSGITGNVVVSGTNINDAAITDTITLNGASTVEGIKAFKTVTNVHLPARTHAPAAQVETATVVGTVTLAGNAKVIVTAAGMTGSPKTYEVAVALNDTASQVAAKIIAVLAADAALTALYAVGGTGATVTLTAVAPAANDATLNIETNNDTCTGLTHEASSANTTAGVAIDKVSVGIAKNFGMPHVIAEAALVQDCLFNGTADGGTMAVSANVEQNLYPLQGTPDGTKLLDIYYLV